MTLLLGIAAFSLALPTVSRCHYTYVEFRRFLFSGVVPRAGIGQCRGGRHLWGRQPRPGTNLVTPPF